MPSISYFAVSGMTCGSCLATITEMVGKLDGVEDVSVSLLTEEAKVHHDSTRVLAESIIETIEACGFDARLLRAESLLPATVTSKFSVQGMTCGACVSAITSAVQQLEGVSNVSVSLITDEAVVEHYGSVTTDAIVASMEDCGFEAQFVSTNIAQPPTHTTKFAVGGMTCVACSSSITQALEADPNVKRASVSLLTSEASVEHTANIDAATLAEIIENCGFDAELQSLGESAIAAQNSLIVNEDVSLQVLGVTDDVDLVDLEYNIEARLNLFEGILGHRIAFNVSISNINPTLTTDANSAEVQSLRPEHHRDNNNNTNVIDEVFITYNPQVVGIRDIVDALNAINSNILFTVINLADQSSTAQLKLLSRVKEIEYWRLNFFKAVLFGVPVFVLSHVQHVDFWRKLTIIPGLYLVSLIQLVLGFHVQFHLGATFLKKFYRFLRSGCKNASMDVLVSISTLVSFLFSVFAIVLSVWNADTKDKQPPKLLMDTVCMLILFISVGKWLENKAKGATSLALSKLLSLTPTNCTIVTDTDRYFEILKSSKDKLAINDSLFTTKEIGVDLVQVGDVAVISPGDKIPADGRILMGVTEIDESFITGETLPVFKSIGDEVIGGSVNGSGLIHIRVLHTGKSSQLQQIISLVKDSQINKAPVQGFADYVASRFVPTVLLLALFTFTIWAIVCFTMHRDKLPHAFSLERNGKFFVCLKLSISVIVVACPCALGLAAPTAMMVGTGVGASYGVLIKGGESLERASDIDIILFDKTGTLTTGEMNLTSYRHLLDSKIIDNEVTWWMLIGSVENNSEHPVGRALTKAARDKVGLRFENDSFDTEITNFKVMSGLGIRSLVRLGSNELFDVFIGNERMVEQHFGGLSFVSEIQKSDPEQNNTFAYVIVNGNYTGFVSLSDKVKPHAREVLDYLQYERNIIVGIVTGDNKHAANKIGKELGIPDSNVFSDVSPIHKDKVIIEIKERFSEKNNMATIAFVGDGINDAPALVQADVGMAISSGSDIAIELADIVLVGGSDAKRGHSDLYGVPIALSISKATFLRIKINFVWAAVYNLIMLPFAMGCFLYFNLMLPPMAAALSMALSSVSVVMSSLLLKKWKPPVIELNSRMREEDVGTPFSLKTSSIEDFRHTRNRNIVWKVLSSVTSRDSQSYELLASEQA